jgi:hypothetical protein
MTFEEAVSCTRASTAVTFDPSKVHLLADFVLWELLSSFLFLPYPFVTVSAAATFASSRVSCLCQPALF